MNKFNFTSQLKERTYLIYLGFFLLSAFFYYYFLEQAFMLGDDYYYGTFYQSGLTNLFNEVKIHYLSINGRIVVHLFAGILLLWDSLFFALFGLLCWIYISFSLLEFRYPGSFGEKNGSISRFCLLFTVLTVYLLTIDILILKETLLWISAFFNYIFPLCLLLTLLLCLRKEKNFGYIFVLSLLLGATTEQIGLISLVCVLFLGIFRKKFQLQLYNWKVSCALLGVGFASVMLSPGSIRRMGMESGGDFTNIRQYLGTIRDLTGVLVSPEGGMYHIMAFFCLVPCYFMLVESQKKQAGAWVAFALTMVLSFTISTSRILHFVLIVLGFASLCLVFLLKNRHYYVLFLGAGCGTIVSIIPSSFTEPRVVFPFLLFLGFATALMALEVVEAVGQWYFKRGGERIQGNSQENLCIFTVLLLLNVFYVIVIPGTLEGLKGNMEIERHNLEQIKNSSETGEIAYLMDYNLDYSHILFIHNGFHYNAFMKYNNIPPEVKFRTWSQLQPMIEIQGETLDFPSYEENGVVYLPLELVVTALGGYCWWTPTQTEVGIGEYRYLLKNGNAYLDSRTDPEDQEEAWDLVQDSGLLSAFYLSLASKTLVEDLFCLEVTLIDGVYQVKSR